MVTITTATEKEWAALYQTSPFTSSFHDYAWCRIVERSLGGNFSPHVAHDSANVSYLLPVFCGAPWSSPKEFKLGAIGYGGPCPTTHNGHDLLVRGDIVADIVSLLEAKLERKFVGMSLYPSTDWPSVFKQFCRTTHILSLDRSPAELFDTVLTGNVRTCVRRAMKSELEISVLNESDADKVHTLLSATQEAVGAHYTTSPLLLREILGWGGQHVLAFGARLHGELIAASVFLLNSNEAFHLFNGWDRKFASHCPNQLLIWNAIEIACNRHISRFNLGESPYDSLADAKDRWGAQRVPVPRSISREILMIASESERAHDDPSD